MLRASLIPILALAALAGCADTTRATAQAAAEATPKVRCDRETQIGSLMPKKDCGPSLSEEDKQRLAAELRNKATPTGVSAPGK